MCTVYGIIHDLLIPLLWSSHLIHLYLQLKVSCRPGLDGSPPPEIHLLKTEVIGHLISDFTLTWVSHVSSGTLEML